MADDTKTVTTGDQQGTAPIPGDPNAAGAQTDPTDRAVSTSAAGEPDKTPAKTAKSAHIVWAQPGHERFRPGDLLKVPGDVAADLRGAGRARYAAPEEVKAGKDLVQEVDAV